MLIKSSNFKSFNTGGSQSLVSNHIISFKNILVFSGVFPIFTDFCDSYLNAAEFVQTEGKGLSNLETGHNVIR